ncbi:MAG: hypothetical protein IT365_03300 [Candidatus Hydrogenedentes bacterium]|nr:hypothetical protein [Candidatus Hydrogenedentota bacterium]
MKPHSSTSNSDRRVVLRFLARGAVLAALVCAGQIAIYWWRWPGDTPPPVLALERIQDEGTDVLFLGDSTVFTSREDDSDHSSIPEMLRRAAPDLRIEDICDAAFNLTLYEGIAHYVEDAETPVATVVFPINMRLVGPQHERLPYRYVDKELLFLRHRSFLFRIAYRPLASFKAFTFRSVTVEDFQQLPVLDGTADLGPVGEFNPQYEIHIGEEQRTRLVTFFYMYSLTSESQALAEFGRSLDALHRAGIRALPYITPLDVEAGEQYLGARFRTRIRENVAYFKNAAEARGVQLLDLSEALPGSCFIRGSYPDEHLRDTGRKAVADRLAEALRQQ